jgi:hypothetical protein
MAEKGMSLRPTIYVAEYGQAAESSLFRARIDRGREGFGLAVNGGLGTAAIPPGIARPEDLAIEEAAVGQHPLGDGPPGAVCGDGPDGYLGRAGRQRPIRISSLPPRAASGPMAGWAELAGVGWTAQLDHCI